jgi:hypothetical protein
MAAPDLLRKAIGEWSDVLEQIVFQVLLSARCEAVAEVGLAYVRASWNTDDPAGGLESTPDFRWRPDISDWSDETARRTEEVKERAKGNPLDALFYRWSHDTRGFRDLVDSRTRSDLDAAKRHRLMTEVQAGGYHFVALVEFDEAATSGFPSYEGNNSEELIRRPISLLDACVRASLEWFAGELSKSLYNRAHVSTRDVEAILRHAGAIVMANVQSHTSNKYGMGSDLFIDLDRVSTHRHERAEARGSIAFMTTEDLAKGNPVSLEEKVPFHRTRWVRKLLEVCHHDMCLASAGDSVDAVFARTRLEPRVLTVEFRAQHKWTLSAEGRPLMLVEGGLPSFPSRGLPQSRFEGTFLRIFPSHKQTLGVVWETVSGMLSAGHGALIVIAEDAPSEARRLREHGTLIFPRILSNAESRAVASVDGAILLDPHGTCYAFGVVLDGEASTGGTPERGARFNSAVRYVSGGYDRLAVVRSEDGPVDLLPRLRPQVKRSELDSALESVRQATSGPITRALREQAQLVFTYRGEIDTNQDDYVQISRLRRIVRSVFGEDPRDDEIFDSHPPTDFLPE